MISFQDTEIAFKHLSNAELKHAYRLFTLMGSSFLVQLGPKLIQSGLRAGLPIEGLVKKTLFDQFCGGISLEDTSKRIEALYGSGVYTILDYSVEGEQNESGFEACKNEIIHAIEFAAGKPEIAFVALKVSGLASTDAMTALQSGNPLNPQEVIDLANGKKRLKEICLTADKCNKPIFIDAEESWFQDVIDLWAEEMMAYCNKRKAVVFTTAQMYRTDRLDYLQRLLEKSKSLGFISGIKLVRGAYMEKERIRAREKGYTSPIHADKTGTDDSFNKGVAFVVEHLEHFAICAGTHNEISSASLADIMDRNNLPHDHPSIWFAQLLGMSDHISFNLAANGFKTAKYLPYGPVKSVLPYLFRRAEENSSIAGQTSRELSLLKSEIFRRKL